MKPPKDINYVLVEFNSFLKFPRQMKDFQQTVNTAAGNRHLEFTAKIWTNEANFPTPKKEYRVQIMMDNEFPFLDMKMRCSPEGDMQIWSFQGKETAIELRRQREHPLTAFCSDRKSRRP